MPIVDLIAIRCTKCEQGFMYKSTLQDNTGNPAYFALVYNYKHNTIVFQGYCSHCGQEFQQAYILESMLHYRNIDLP